MEFQNLINFVIKIKLNILNGKKWIKIYKNGGKMYKNG